MNEKFINIVTNISITKQNELTESARQLPSLAQRFPCVFTASRLLKRFPLFQLFSTYQLKPMSNKRSRRKQAYKFYCPHCNRRLWRIDSPKYPLFYFGKLEIQKSLNLSHKTASFLASQSPTLVDRNVWLEAFFCEEDGKVWMHVSRANCGQLTVKLATREDW